VNKKTTIVNIAILASAIGFFVYSFAFFVFGASVTPKFPATANNFAEGDIIEEEDWNAIENRIGTTATTGRASITYQLDQLMGTSTLPNLASIGTITTGTWTGQDVTSPEATSTDLHASRIFTTSSSTIGFLTVGAINATSTATSTFENGIRILSGCFRLPDGTCAGTSGITSLNGLTGTTQTFTNDTNVTISSVGSAHTLGWSGTLGLSRGGTAASLSGANQIVFLNSGNTALTNASGFVFDGTNFGIGTSTPGSSLSIHGAGNFATGSSTLYSVLTLPSLTSTSTVSTTTFEGNGIIFRDPADTYDYFVLSRSFRAANKPGIYFTQTGAASNIYKSGAGIDLPSSRNLAFYTSNLTTLAERVRINESGNFGIGTTTPGTLLAVSGTTNITGTSSLASLVTTNTFLVGTSSQYRFRVLESGNIGLGATSTESILSIQNSANFYQNATSTIYNGLSTPLLHVTSNTASSTFEGGIVINGGLRLRLNCSGLTSNGSLTTNALGDVICDPDDGGGGAVTVNSGTASRLSYYSGATTIDAATNILVTNSPATIGIGTTTTRYAFVASSTVGSSGFMYSAEFDIGTVTTSPINVDWRAGNPQRMTLGITGVTVNMENLPAGGKGVLVVCQDGSGGRDITIWDSAIRWSGKSSTTQSSAAGACDMFGFVGTKGTSTPPVIYRGEASISE